MGSAVSLRVLKKFLAELKSRSGWISLSIETRLMMAD